MLHLEGFKYNKNKIDDTNIYRYFNTKNWPGDAYIGKFNLEEDIVLMEGYKRDEKDDLEMYSIYVRGQDWRNVNLATEWEIEIYELKHNVNNYNL